MIMSVNNSTRHPHGISAQEQKRRVNKHFFAGRKIYSAILLIALTACSKNSDSPVHSSNHQVTIHTEDKKQIIRNFGASDAWTIQFVGLWPEEKRAQVADWLFSTEENADGSPKGIGLSLWRFNIGAGSASQNNISDAWRASEGFLKNDLSYDWSKQAGQRWFLAAAKARGVNQFTGFTNSPPVQLTKNGNAFSGDGTTANLSPANYISFTKFLVDVAKHFNEENIPFTYLSPFNEPQWDWTGNGQEGTPYKNAEMYEITRKLDSLITAEGLNVKLQIAEAGKLNYLYENADKPGRGNQVSEFFHDQSPFYIGDLPNVDKVISGHSYFTAAPVATLIDVRQKVSASVSQASVPIEFWQSEYCLLGDQEEITPHGKSTGMDPALYVARLIHHDLTIANASAWHWWLAVSAYDYKDGLIYVDKNETDGAVEDTRLLWALGNFSRFIRPGSQRLALTASGINADDPKGLMVSSYLNPESNRIVVVMINYGYNDIALTVNTDGSTVQYWKPYITGKEAGEKLKPLAVVNAQGEVTIPARSVITLVEEE